MEVTHQGGYVPLSLYPPPPLTDQQQVMTDLHRVQRASSILSRLNQQYGAPPAPGLQDEPKLQLRTHALHSSFLSGFPFFIPPQNTPSMFQALFWGS